MIEVLAVEFEVPVLEPSADAVVVLELAVVLPLPPW